MKTQTIAAGVKKTASKTPAKRSVVRKTKNDKVRPTPEGIKRINLALQGGGAHGAFAWGVMDKFLEDGRIEIEGISGTSTGSMNAVVYAYGALKGKDAARTVLHDYWQAISNAGQRYSMVKQTPWEQMFGGWSMERSIASEGFKLLTSTFSPYQLNPMNFNPLRELLDAHVDFEELVTSRATKLFLSATNVRTGKVRVFHTREITADVVLASACLPFLFQAVEIDGEHYWDGGYMGNPALYPLFYHTDSRDVVILQINPVERAGPPTQSSEIANRVNEITFNSALIKELRSVYFVQQLLDQGKIKEEYRDDFKYMLIHSIRADSALSDLPVSSKFAYEWDFLTMLRDRGRDCASEWIDRYFKDIGIRSTVDLKREFL